MNLTGKKVLITGAGGFIGSHLAESLVKEGCKVKGLIRYNSMNFRGWLDAIDSKTADEIEIIYGDIRDGHSVNKAITGSDIVFHLAALISIPYSYQSPGSFTETNVTGTLNILEAARNASAEKIIITSSSEVYGTARYVPINEEHPRQGQSPYSASKIGADYLTQSYVKSYNLPAVTVRPFNTFGPRQSARAIIPSIIIQLLNGNGVVKLGSLHPTRDLVYVKDTVEGFMEISKSDELTGEEVNIATGTETSISELADKLISLINPSAKILEDKERIRPASSEVERLLGSDEKIKKYTTWNPKYTLEKGLTETIEWFRDSSNLSKYKYRQYNT